MLKLKDILETSKETHVISAWCDMNIEDIVSELTLE